MCDEWNQKRNTIQLVKIYNEARQEEINGREPCCFEGHEDPESCVDKAGDRTKVEQAMGVQTTEVKGNIVEGDGDDREYWRPRYMFHWLRAMGGNIKDAYKTFETYRGKESYKQLELEPPKEWMETMNAAKNSRT